MELQKEKPKSKSNTKKKRKSEKVIVEERAISPVRVAETNEVPEKALDTKQQETTKESSTLTHVQSNERISGQLASLQNDILDYAKQNQSLSTIYPTIDEPDVTSLPSAPPLFEEDERIPEYPDLGEIEATAPPFHDVLFSSSAQPVTVEKILNIRNSPYLNIKQSETIEAIHSARQITMALTEEKLTRLYVNPLVDELPELIDEFWNNSQTIHDEFYDRVREFEKAQAEVQNTKMAIQKLHNSARNVAAKLWMIESKTDMMHAQCGDGSDISHSYSYQVAKYQSSESSKLAKVLARVREESNTKLYKCMYQSKMAKLWVQNHIDAFLWQSPTFSAVGDWPLSPSRRGSDISDRSPAKVSSLEGNKQDIEQLKHMLGTLFHFEIISKGRPDFEPSKYTTSSELTVTATEEDNEQSMSTFNRAIRGWITHLAAALLASGSFKDRLFLLFHILRCKGIGEWGSQLLQSPVPEVWSNAYLDEFLVILATLLNPGPGGTPSVVNGGASSPLLAQSGQRELVLSEDDHMALLEQLNVSEVFYRFLSEQIQRYDDALKSSLLSQANRSLLQLFAISNAFLQTLTHALSVFPREQFPNLIKRLAQSISQISRILGQEVFEDHNSAGVEPSKKRSSVDLLAVAELEASVQAELDAFITRTMKYLLALPKFGVWHFMVEIPFHVASVEALWKIFCNTVGLDIYTTPRTIKHFVDKQFSSRNITTLISENTAEGIFLLTCLSNLATVSRTQSETSHNPFETEDNKDAQALSQLIAVAVTRTILDVAYLDIDLREQFYKPARDLLFNICLKYPSTISQILSWVSDNFAAVGQMALYLFRSLPLKQWPVTVDDLNLLHTLLCKGQLLSTEYQFAKYIIEEVNWSFRNDHLDGNDVATPLQARRVPFLPYEIHQEAAFMLAEMARELQPTRDAEKAASSYVSAVRSAVGIFNNSSDNVKKDFLAWCWKIVLQLKLYDGPVLSRSVDIDFELTPSSSNAVLKNGFPNDTLSSQRALLAYVSFMLSDASRSFLKFEMLHGIDYINFIIRSGQSDAVVKIVSEIIPSFIYLHGDDFFNEMGWFRIFSELVNFKVDPFLANAAAHYIDWNHAIPFDDIGEPMNGLQLIIGSHAWQARNIDDAYQFSAKSGEGFSYLDLILHSWLRTVVAFKDWMFSPNFVAVVDYISKIAFTLRRDGLVRSLLSEEWKKLEDSNRANTSGGPNGPMQFMRTMIPIGGGGYPSLLVGDGSALLLAANNLLNHPGVESSSIWFTFEELILETLMEKDSRREIALYLWEHSRNNTTSDLASMLKNSGVQSRKPLDFFTVYRWLQHILVINPEHPLLPLFLQTFFCLYFANFQPKTTSTRFFYGHLFFSRKSDLLDKLRDRIAYLQTYHGQKMRKGPSLLPKADSKSEKGENKATPLQLDHDKLHTLYYAMWLWLKEPRLLKSETNIETLPEQFCISNLQSCFDTNPIGHSRSFWLDMVDMDGLQTLFNSFPWIGKAAKIFDPIQSKDQILQKVDPRPDHFRAYGESPSKPPPHFALRKPFTVPTEKQMETLESAELFSSTIRILKHHGRTFADHIDRHKSFDSTYMQQLQSLYRNESKRTHLKIPCSKVPAGICRSPATFDIQHQQFTVDSDIQQVLIDNRTAVEDLTLGTVDSRICVSALVGICTIERIVQRVKIIPTDGSSLSVVDNHFKNLSSSVFQYIFEGFVDDSKFYPPAKLFLQSMIRTLGTYLGTQQTYVSTILDLMDIDEHKVLLLYSVFDPSKNPSEFVNYFARVSDSSIYSMRCQSKLLERFNAEDWIRAQSNPQKKDRESIYQIGFEAMKKYGQSPSNDQLAILKLYRQLISSLLKARPEDTRDFFEILLDACASGKMNRQIFKDVMATLGCNFQSIQSIVEISKDEFATLILQREQLYSVIDLFEKYFTAANSKYGPIYTIFGHYVDVLVYIFTAFLCEKRILLDTQYAAGGWSSWDMIRRCYSPWIFAVAHSVQHKGRRASMPSGADSLTIEEQQIKLFMTIIASFVTIVHKLLWVRHDEVAIFIPMVWKFAMELAEIGIKANYLKICYMHLANLSWDTLDIKNEAAIFQIIDVQSRLELDERTEFLRFVMFLIRRQQWSQENENAGDMCIQATAVCHLIFTLVQQLDAIFPDDVTRGENLTALRAVMNSLPSSFLDIQEYELLVNKLKRKWQPPISQATLSQGRETSALWCCLTWLRQLGSFESADPKIPHLRLYVNYTIELLTQSFSKVISSEIDRPNFAEDAISVAVGDLLALLDKVVGSSSVTTPTDIDPLLRRVVSLLNSIPKSDRSFDSLWRGILNGAKVSNHIELPLLLVACQCIASIEQMVLLVEVCVERHFNITKNFSEWNRIATQLVIPELGADNFIGQTLETSSVLTLYAICLQKLSDMGGQSEAELEIAEEMVSFISVLKVPLGRASAKCVVMLRHFADIFSKDDLEDLKEARLMPCLVSLYKTLERWSEDKDSRGLLGSLGLGSRSPFSIEFRLFSKILTVFLASRLHDAEVGFSVDPTPVTESLRSLLVKNKEYAPLKEHIEWGLAAAKDKERKIHELKELIIELTRRLFPLEPYLCR